MVASVRPTEGSRKGRPGRPKHARNKSRSMVPKSIGNKLLSIMEEQLSPDQFSYLKGVIKEGRPIRTKDELDTLIALLTRNLYPALIAEMMPSEDGGYGGIYRKDVTDRLKIVQSLLSLRYHIDKNDEPDSDKSDTILTITSKRGFNIERLGVLVGQQSDSLERSPDGVGGETNSIRALSDTLSERQEHISDSEQGSPDWVLDRDSDGGYSLHNDENDISG